MCTSCGEFVQAKREEGSLAPLSEKCPDCGGREFLHNESGTVIRTEQ